MPKKILQKEAAVLRKVAEPVSEIKSEKTKKILAEMKQALDSQDDGVAIAAPQIGYSLRIFVISPKITSSPNLVYIKPVIQKISKNKKLVEEGCLSVRYLYGQVSRSTKATIEAYDENGKKFTKGASGLIAQIFQHEVDHLNGVLFTDKAKSLEEIPPKS